MYLHCIFFHYILAVTQNTWILNLSDNILSTVVLLSHMSLCLLKRNMVVRQKYTEHLIALGRSCRAASVKLWLCGLNLFAKLVICHLIFLPHNHIWYICLNHLPPLSLHVHEFIYSWKLSFFPVFLMFMHITNMGDKLIIKIDRAYSQLYKSTHVWYM